MSDTGQSSSSEEAWPESDPCDCVICILLSRPFSRLAFVDKQEIISIGRPTPALKGLTQQTKSFVRHFQTDNYKRCEWLTGCPTKARLYCWYCLLFSDHKNSWNKYGYVDLNNLPKLVQRHSLSHSHLSSMIKLKTLGKAEIKPQVNPVVSDMRKLQDERHNRLVKNNRDIFRRLIDVTCFLAELGPGESNESSIKGNFKGLVELIAKYDEPLNSHLRNTTEFQYPLSDIHTNLIASLGKILLGQIKQESLDASFVSLILSDTGDVHEARQLSVILRYFIKGEIKERLLGFQDPGARDINSVFAKVKFTMTEYNCGDRLVSQSYDGACVMPDQLKGLQTKVKKTYPNALPIHCMAHRLSTVLAQSVSNISECKIFFSNLKSFAVFFSKSDERVHALDEHARKRFCTKTPTRWNYNIRLVSTVIEYREPLIDLFESIVANFGNHWDSETTLPSRGFLDLLKTDFDFNFLLIFFGQIFPFCDSLFDVLHSTKIDIKHRVQEIDEFKKLLESTRDGFKKIWKQTSELDLEPKTKRLRSEIETEHDDEASSKLLLLFHEILDNISAQVEVRFGNFDELKFLELLNFPENKDINESALEALKLNYGNYFDLPLLQAQLSAVYDTDVGLNKESVRDMYQSLVDTGLGDGLSEVRKLCELGTIIAPHIAAAELSVSALKRIKTFVRNSPGQAGVSSFSFLSFEKELLQRLREGPNFYDHVIDEYAKSDKRIPLHFK